MDKDNEEIGMYLLYTSRLQHSDAVK